MLQKPDIIADVLDRLPDKKDGSGWFYNIIHEALFNRIKTMWASDVKIDAATVTQSLLNAGELEKVGGGVAVMQILDSVPTAEGYGLYVDTIKQKARQRKLIEIGCGMVSASFETEPDCGKIVGETVNKLTDIDDQSKKPNTAAGLIPEVERQLAILIRDDSKCIGIPSGFKSIDFYTRGFRGGQLVVVGAYPSEGKSSLGMNIAFNDASHDIPVGVCSLEDGAEMYLLRMASSISNVNLRPPHKRNIAEKNEAMARLSDATERIKQMPLYVCDDALSSEQIGVRARKWVAQYGIKMLFVDYLQRMELPNSDPRIGSTMNVTFLKNLAQKLSIPIVLFSQLTREGRQYKRPQIWHFKETGAVEEQADIALLLSTGVEAAELPDDIDGNAYSKEELAAMAYIGVKKNKNGPQGACVLKRNLRVFRFDEIDWRTKAAISPELQREIDKQNG